MAKRTLGILNKNPLNVKQVPSLWDGSTGQDEYGHAIFIDNIYGIRAAVRTLANMFRAGNRTVAEIIAQWAPANDPQANNDPLGYAGFVSRKMGIPADTNLDLFTVEGKLKQRSVLYLMIAAMIEFENFRGYMLPLETLSSGIALYERDFT